MWQISLKDEQTNRERKMRKRISNIIVTTLKSKAMESEPILDTYVQMMFFRGHVLGRYIVRVEASSLSDLEVRTRAYISNVVSKGGRAFVVKGVSVERIREIETHLLTSAIRGLQSETS